MKNYNFKKSRGGGIKLQILNSKSSKRSCSLPPSMRGELRGESELCHSAIPHSNKQESFVSHCNKRSWFSSGWHLLSKCFWIKTAFTLVELIVIITILAILWTICFISIQNYASSARDTKRISDTRNLLEKVNIEQTKWTPLEQLMDTEDQKPNNLTINWVLNTPWYQGIINFITLNEPANSFKDPKWNQDYPFAYAYWTTTIEWTDQNYKFMQMAYVSETEWTTKLIWNYYKYNVELDSPSLFTNEHQEGIEDNSKDLIYNPWIPEIPKDCNPKTTENWYELTGSLLHNESITLSKLFETISNWIKYKEQKYQCKTWNLTEVWW
jgi:type II secretory pathway pseudopilin PulG